MRNVALILLVISSTTALTMEMNRPKTAEANPAKIQARNRRFRRGGCQAEKDLSPLWAMEASTTNLNTMMTSTMMTTTMMTTTILQTMVVARHDSHLQHDYHHSDHCHSAGQRHHRIRTRTGPQALGRRAVARCHHSAEDPKVDSRRHSIIATHPVRLAGPRTPQAARSQQAKHSRVAFQASAVYQRQSLRPGHSCAAKAHPWIPSG